MFWKSHCSFVLMAMGLPVYTDKKQAESPNLVAFSPKHAPNQLLYKVSSSEWLICWKEGGMVLY